MRNIPELLIAKKIYCLIESQHVVLEGKRIVNGVGNLTDMVDCLNTMILENCSVQKAAMTVTTIKRR